MCPFASVTWMPFFFLKEDSFSGVHRFNGEDLKDSTMCGCRNQCHKECHTSSLVFLGPRKYIPVQSIRGRTYDNVWNPKDPILQKPSPSRALVFLLFRFLLSDANPGTTISRPSDLQCGGALPTAWRCGRTGSSASWGRATRSSPATGSKAGARPRKRAKILASESKVHTDPNKRRTPRVTRAVLPGSVQLS